LATGDPVLRYGIPIGFANKPIAAGCWVHERLLEMPGTRGLTDLPISTVKLAAPSSADLAKMQSYTFEGYRNADGSVGTRNILALTQTVQCVAGMTDFAVQRIKAELLPLYPNVDDVVSLAHTYGCGVAIEAPAAEIPIRTLRNISTNPNFGGEVMVVSLGCEKLQPARLLPLGSIDIAKCWDKLCWAGASVGRSGIATQAIGAFDVALWDFKASVPIYHWLNYWVAIVTRWLATTPRAGFCIRLLTS
jgi:galactarate dehydratase